MRGDTAVQKKILTDGGPEFANEILSELTQALGSEHLLTTPYSKEENAIVERTNKEVLRFLQNITFDKFVQDKWPDYLPLIQRIINATVHESIGVTPASLLFGNQIQLDRNIIIPFDHNTNPNRKLSDYVRDMMQAQTTLIRLAQTYQDKKDFKHLTSKAVTPTEFLIGTYVLAQYPRTRMGRKPPTKLHAPWRGPLRVVNNIGSKYTLQNLVTGKLEDLHVSSLKEFLYDPNLLDPKEVAFQDQGARLIEEVLAHEDEGLHFVFKCDLPPEEKVKWEFYNSIANNVVLHDYLRKNKMKTLIPTNLR